MGFLPLKEASYVPLQSLHFYRTTPTGATLGANFFLSP